MRWLKITFVGLLSIVLLLLALVWVLSPSLSRSLINDILSDNYVQLTPTSVIRLDPFRSKLTINDLVLTREQQQPFTLDTFEVQYRLLPLLFSREVYIPKVYLHGLSVEVDIQQDAQKVAGIEITITETAENDKTSTTQPSDISEPLNKDQASEDVAQTSGQNAIHVRMPNIELSDLRVIINHLNETHEVVFERITLENSYFNKEYSEGISQESAESQLDIKALVNNSPIQLSAAINYDGKLAVDFSSNLQQIDSQYLQYVLPEEIKELQGKVDLETGFNLTLHDKTVNIGNIDITLGVDGFQVKTQGLAAQFDQYKLGVTGQVNILDGSPTIDLTANTSLNNLRVNNSENLDGLADIENLQINNIQLSVNGDDYDVQADNLIIDNFTGSQRVLNESLKSFAAINLENTGNPENTENSKNKDGSQLPALAHLKQVSIADISLNSQQLSVSDIVLSGGDVHVWLDKAGELTTLIDTDFLTAADSSEASEDAEPDKAVAAEKAAANMDKDPNTDIDTEAGDIDQQAQPFAIKVKKVSLAEPIKVNFIDASQNPSINQNYFVDTLTLNNIDSKNIEDWLDFTVAINDGEFFKLTTNGKAQPFKDAVNAEIKANIREFSLPVVSPYLAKHLNFEFKTGQLDTDFTGTIVDSNLDAKAKLLLRAADFSAAQKTDSNIIGQAAIPLNVALGMLKDGDGNIKLKIPLTGRLDDPEFGMEYILGLVVKRAAMRQAKSYLVNTFVPYASVVSIGLAAGSYALKVRFEDLPYQPGQTELAAEQATFVEQLVALMTDKPDLVVKVCPIVTVADLASTEVAGADSAAGSDKAFTDSQKEQLHILANVRANAFKAEIVSKGVVSARLLVCSPRIDTKAKAITRIAFSV